MGANTRESLLRLRRLFYSKLFVHGVVAKNMELLFSTNSCDDNAEDDDPTFDG
jgi:hypothetical protein